MGYNRAVGESLKKKKRARKTGVLDRRFQENLRRLREARGMKQRELAEAIGWPNTNFVSQLETGIRGFSNETVERLAAYFRVDPGEFFQAVERRKKMRLLFEDSPAAFIQQLRGTELYDTLIGKFRAIVIAEESTVRPSRS